VQEVAESTLMCLKTTVPAILPGIVFLSGGQDDERATAHLDAMNRLGPNPWTLSFSYGRAMQQAALQLWARDMENNLRKAQGQGQWPGRAGAVAGRLSRPPRGAPGNAGHGPAFSRLAGGWRLTRCAARRRA